MRKSKKTGLIVVMILCVAFSGIIGCMSTSDKDNHKMNVSEKISEPEIKEENDEIEEIPEIDVDDIVDEAVINDEPAPAESVDIAVTKPPVQEEPEKEPESVPVVTEPVVPERETVVEEEVYNGPTVYITPTGKKYHYSSSCAGKNAIEKSLDNVRNSYGPCKKCAQ